MFIPSLTALLMLQTDPRRAIVLIETVEASVVKVKTEQARPRVKFLKTETALPTLATFLKLKELEMFT